MPNDRMLLSIVCPAYEEEQVLETFHAALCDALTPLASRYRLEIVYVDDGSRDRTFHVIRSLAASDSRVRGYSLSRNFGHQAALSAGLAQARGDAVITLDSDMQHPPTLIPTLVEQWRTGFDIVQTIRADDDKLSWFKRASSHAFYRAMGYFSDVEIRPAAADFRLMSRRAADALLQMGESHRFLRGMVHWLGFRVAEVPFEPLARRAGVSKYTLQKMLRLAFDGLYSFSRAPVRLAVAAGFAATFLSLAASLLYTWSHGGGLPLTCLLLAVHLVPATLFAALGVVGEYLCRVHEECKRRPLYVVKAETPDVSEHRRQAA